MENTNKAKTTFDELETKKAIARGNFARNTSEWLLDKINALRFRLLDNDFTLTDENDNETKYVDSDFMLEQLENIYTLACRLNGVLTEDEYIMLEPTEEE